MAPSSNPRPAVADSWDDEPSDTEPAAPPSRPATTTRPSPPRPSGPPQPWEQEDGPSPASPATASDKRPEKSTAVASRLIAAGLGVRAPRRTEEQRGYDKAVREQERKRKEAAIQEEKRKVAERERAKAAMWDD